MKSSRLIVALLTLLLVGYAVVFDCLPRSQYSELERRELQTFPVFSWQRLWSGDYTSEVSQWFSDTEPFRDFFMAQSMRFRSWMALHFIGEERVSFHASDTDEEVEDVVLEEEPEALGDQRTIGEYHNEVTADENAKIANAGIIVVGSAPTARALMAFKAQPPQYSSYARVANKYKEVFGEKVQVYCMVIPTAVEFYCPDMARSTVRSEREAIEAVYSQLDDSVRAVDAYTPISQHVSEPIYLRTDHHWSPLGAYYAARQFAQVAGVPVPDISNFERHEVEGYVGSMYGYTQDISIRQSPELFVYYTPQDVEYTTTYIPFVVDEHYQVIGEKSSFRGEFFWPAQGGNAYCTFMGKDSRITQVHTNVPSHRRLLILKDSFGNALPGYLFQSFEEIHVVDFRYFTYNMKEYVAQHSITDILFANNITHSYSAGKPYLKFLTQHPSDYVVAPATESISEPES